MTARRWTYALAAALSGAVWFGVALVLDSEVGGGWSIPRDGVLSHMTFVSCGVLTGIVVSYLFRPAYRRCALLTEGAVGCTGRVLSLCLPLATIPVGVALFAFLVWVARQTLGYHFSPDPGGAGELLRILETYLFFSMASFAVIVLYPLSLFNQHIMVKLLRSEERR